MDNFSKEIAAMVDTANDIINRRVEETIKRFLEDFVTRPNVWFELYLEHKASQQPEEKKDGE